MSSYYAASGYSYIVRLTMRDAAIKCLSNDGLYECGKNHQVQAVELDDGRFQLDPDYPPFAGYWSGDHLKEEVSAFIKTYCEPGSYASFRNDDYLEYEIYGKDEHGQMFEDWRELVNPFEKRMRELDERALGMFKRKERSMGVKETEHVKHGCIDHCPACGEEKSDGYDDLDFTMTSVLARYTCGNCGTEYTEEYAYKATYHYTCEEE